MAHARSRRDRYSITAFAAFWVVIALGVVLGYAVVHAMGLAGHPGATRSNAHNGSGAVATATPVDGPPQLTVASIFAAKPPNLSTYDRSKLRTLIATGDVIPARSVNYHTIVVHNDFRYPWRPTAAYLRTGDITLINLESPLIGGCPVTVEGMSFCGDPGHVQGLKFAGVDTACTANNHIGNYGDAGITETWQHLRDAGIGYCGLGKIDHKTVRGLTFAFLAYNCVGQRFDYATARAEIRAARKTADVVVVSVHWGKEYVLTPRIAPGIAEDNPRQVGHWIIDSGADLVIGNHPHHVQGVEIYRGHLITYAHGNFIFDQMFSQDTEEGVVGTYTFYGKRLVAVRYRPVHIYDYAQPRWASPQEAAAVLKEMRDSSWLIAHGKA